MEIEINPDTLNQPFVEKIEKFYEIASLLKVMDHKQVVKDSWYFGDVFQEYKDTLDCIKVFII